MKTNNILILYILFSLFIGCKKNEKNQNTTSVLDTKKVRKTDALNNKINAVEKIRDKSFVISCGTSCAMTYSAEQIIKNNSIFKVKFNVDNYINEELADTYKETYSFIYDKSNNIDKILLEGTNQNALETLPYGAKESFIEFSKQLLKPTTNTGNYFKFSSSILPYKKKIDINKINYNSMLVSNVNGLSKFACGEKEVRYIPLDKREKVNIILVPQDCGDMPYRFYLVCIYNNSVVSNLYVEGESHEPESDGPAEKTNFTIDENSILIVNTINKNFEIGVNDEKKYQIQNDGNIVKL
ncbi:Uncharacterised protein [Chryseobacterium taklimakanense]|uniref:Lipoprotein n=1 Tax=Chryseobacterium taklimakanense TaxID=536441 RepID=A0A239WJQ2_9FLAO|nr:hypothetical protein [Chryseobacterium taklimakanense]SNV34687.1 Uncharacterised protein [Chryseobacterium taklimakanense]